MGRYPKLTRCYKTLLVIPPPLLLCRSTLLLWHQHLLISIAIFFSIVLKVSSSWTDCGKLMPSVSLHTEIVLNLKNVSNLFFPTSFWYSCSGIYFKCETSLLLAVFYCLTIVSWVGKFNPKHCTALQTVFLLALFQCK